MKLSTEQTYQYKWESRSSIRTRPRKPLDFNYSGYFFPKEKQSLFLLPEVQELNTDLQNEILILSLKNYLEDICKLEKDWIYIACNNIIDKNMVVSYPNDIKRDACTIIIDEYYHIYIAYDLLNQLRNRFSHLPEFNNNFSDANHAVLTIKEDLHEDYHDIFEILAVCIFETTLIRELVHHFDSNDIHPIIKHYINDHMNDEARHYNFFYQLLLYTWHNLSDDFKQIIGSKLGDFVKLYLNIKGEISQNLNILSWALSDSSKAEGLINQLYHGYEISPNLPIIKNVLKVLNKAGIMSHQNVYRGFKENGLTP